MHIAVTGGKLRGTMLEPDGSGPFPAVLIIAGSGPTDHDGNQPNLINNSLKYLAEGLLKDNIASLRFDKRGIGASRLAGLREEDLRFETYVGDGVAWARYLGRRPSVLAVFLIGHSEGSLIAILAAQKVKVAGLISISGAGLRASEVIEDQLRHAPLAKPLKKETDTILAALLRGQTVKRVSPGLAALFRPSVQPYLISWFRYDPAAEIQRLDIPILVLQGNSDRQIAPRNAELLQRGCARCVLRGIDGMNHVLKRVDGTAEDDIASYGDPERPIAPGLIEAITGFIKGRAAHRQ